MAPNVQPPFSARNRGAHTYRDDDFPESARIGLLHLLHGFVDRQYIESWHEVAHELQRIARRLREGYQSQYAASEAAREILTQMEWQQVYDFCERVHSRLAIEVRYRDQSDDWVVETSRADVQQAITAEMQLLFLEEGLAFDFDGGIVQRRGRRHTNDLVSRANVVLGDPRLEKARKHYEKAQLYFRNTKKPDPQNAIKEAVCAVEAAARALFPEIKGSTLVDVIKGVSGSDAGQIPKTIAKVFEGLYGFRNSGDGVAHGGAEGGPATNELAEFSLGVAASQIIFLVDLAKAREQDIPF